MSATSSHIVTVQEKHLEQLLFQSKASSDRMIDKFLVGYFVFGLVLSFFYDTWLVAIGIGGLSLLAYYAAKFILPQSNVYQYVLSVVLGIYMAQYIYQMHGMFEMHFVAFISSAVLITYQNYKLQIPLLVVVVLHHAIFGYLQFIGFDKIYFTKLAYMDLQTFIIHVLLAGVIFFICGLWAYHFKKYKITHINQTYQLGLLQEKEAHAAEKKITQKQLVQTEANLKTFFSNTHTGYILLDNKYDVITFNKNAEQIINSIYYLPLTLSKTYLDVIHESRKEDEKKILEMVLKGNVNEYEAKYENIHTGADMSLFISMHPVLDNEQNVMGISIALSDVTERQKLEEQVALEKTIKQQEITEAVLHAQENERTEIGKELHDNVNQLLAASCLYIEMARTREVEKDQLLQTSAKYTQTAIEEIRKLAKNLITPLIRHSGLIETIKGLIEDVMFVHPVRIQLKVESFTEDTFNEKFKLNLFRIIQEQINNTLKHAQAGKIEILFKGSADSLSIFISDNGVGFDTAKRKKGVGITNIISRVELYKGTIDVRSAPGEGCLMSIKFLMKDLAKHKAFNSVVQSAMGEGKQTAGKSAILQED